ncbi:MAG: AI-2E family transporter [Rhodospirillaceae bacterium]
MPEKPTAPGFRDQRSDWGDALMRVRSPRASETAVIFAAVVTALYFGREIFVPLALAVLLAFILAPLVLFLRRIHFGRVPSVVVAVLAALIIFIGIGAVIGGQLAQLAVRLPEYQTTIKAKIKSIRGQAGENSVVGRASSLLKDLHTEVTQSTDAPETKDPRGAVSQTPVPVEVREPPMAPLQLIQRAAAPLLQPLATTAIVAIFLFFMLLQREDLRDRFIRLAGARDLQRTTQALDDGVRRLSRYFLMQSAINAGFGTVIAVGLGLIGVPNPVLWGILAMLLRFVPYIGAPLAAVFPAIIAIAVDPGWTMLGWTVGLFVAVEPIIGQVVEPLLYANSTGLSAIAVVIAAAFWTWLWGPVGLLLSTPLTVCLVVLGRHVERLQFLDVLLGDRPALTPEESFYQRLLAGDPDEAARQADLYLKDKSLSDYYDEVAVKGLGLAQLDVNRGVLTHDRQLDIREAITGLVENLADHDDGVSSEGDVESAFPAPWRAAGVLCVAGRGALDEAAARMLAQLVEKRGLGARVVPAQAVSAANIMGFKADEAPMVCLSFLEPGGFTGARYLVRRLRRKLPNTRIMLGLWTLDDAGAARRNAIEETGVDIVATSLNDAVTTILDTARKDAGARRAPVAE